RAQLHPFEPLRAWSFPWASSETSYFNVDLGIAATDEMTPEEIAPWLEAGLPPVVEHNARASGTDIAGYLTESPGFSAWVLDRGTIYQTYHTTAPGPRLLMGCSGILDRAPKGRGGARGRVRTRSRTAPGGGRAVEAIAPPRGELSDAWLARDLSGLEFNRRVLQEALDERNPLLERVKFLAIFSSNLDEFFMKRIAL